ncbi:MAG: KH domain-containing protein [Bacteroidetes bacterium]|nr:KH domain-containing protein [Bacteroidota bacterium]MCL5025558.1 KH domain-containing protein [Chloroflexota bacterium]
MRQLVEYIAKSLVDKPEDVQIREVEGEQSIILELHVAPEDMGRIIGKQGHIARAMRVLLKASAARQGKRAMLEIV